MKKGVVEAPKERHIWMWTYFQQRLMLSHLTLKVILSLTLWLQQCEISVSRLRLDTIRLLVFSGKTREHTVATTNSTDSDGDLQDLHPSRVSASSILNSVNNWVSLVGVNTKYKRLDIALWE